jgi:hypothetical protein
MKPLIITAALALLPCLCTSAANADPTYTASAVLSSPADGSSYPIQEDPRSGLYLGTIPISVTSQFVEITGATPSTYLVASWAMNVTGVYEGTEAISFAQDDSGPNAMILVDANGYFKRWAGYSNQGTYTSNFVQPKPCYIDITAGSGLKDPSGTEHIDSHTHTASIYGLA